MKKIIEKYSERPKDLFRTLYVTFLFGYLPIGLIHIIFNLLEIIPVNFNDKQIYGVKGVLVILLFMPLIVLIVSFFVWLYFIVGNFVLRMVKKIFYE